MTTSDEVQDGSLRAHACMGVWMRRRRGKRVRCKMRVKFEGKSWGIRRKIWIRYQGGYRLACQKS